MKHNYKLFVAVAAVTMAVPAIAAVLSAITVVGDPDSSMKIEMYKSDGNVIYRQGGIIIDGDRQISEEELCKVREEEQQLEELQQQKWKEEEEQRMEIRCLGHKYGVFDMVERPKVEQVGGLYWRYTTAGNDGVNVLTVSPKEYTDDDDLGGDVSGEIAIPEMLGGKTVTEIGDRLLAGKSVSSAVIPHGVTNLFVLGDLSGNVFIGCESLKKFVVADDHPAYSVRDGFLCDKSGKTLFCCPASREGDVVIPDGIETIGDNSFLGCEKMTSLTVPPSVRKAGIMMCGSGYGKLRAVYISDLSAWCRIEFASDGIVSDDTLYQQSNPLCGAHNLFLDGKLVTDLEIPADVESIGAMAFAGCISLRRAVIHGGVTNIGWYAFGGCSALEEVEIREGVKSIKGNAFANCKALREIAIPDSVTTMGVPAGTYTSSECGAFKNCSSLKHATLPKALREIPDNLFMECTELEEVKLPEDLEVIGSGAFFNCRNLRGVDFPRKVRIIGVQGDFIIRRNGAFEGCKGLSGIEIPDSVERIGPCAFADCKHLKKVKIGSGIKEIGAGAFADCVNLKCVEMAAEVDDLGAGAFHNCKRLKFDDRSIPGFKMRKGIVVERTAPLGETLDLTGTKGIADNAIGCGRYRPWEDKVDPELEKLRRVVFPDGYKTIKFEVFSGCRNLCEISVPPSVTRVCGTTFGNIGRTWKHFDKVDISDLAAWSRIDFDVEVAVPCSHCCPGHPGVVVGSSNPLGLGAELRLDGKPVTELVIPGTVERIGRGAFFGYSHLKSVVIEEGVKEIGDFAFFGCTNLVSLTIADSVTKVGDRVFADCKNVEQIAVPSGLNYYIGRDLPQVYTPIKRIDGRRWSYHHDGTNATITGVEPADGDLVIPSEITSGGKTYRVTGIGACAFLGCKGITSVTIPDSVTNIGGRAFEGCRGLAKDGFVIVDGTLFSYVGRSCSELTIPDGVRKIDEFAFDFSDYLLIGANWPSRVIIPDSVTNIENNAFRWCVGLKEVRFGSGLVRIGSSAFVCCTNLESVALPVGLKEIGPNAFNSCSSLTSVTIPDSVANVGKHAFGKCGGLFRNGFIAVGDTIYGCNVNDADLTIPEGAVCIDSLKPAIDDVARLTIPKSVTHVHRLAFCRSKGPTESIVVAEGNPAYVSVSGMLLTKDLKTLVASPKEIGGEVTVPSSVTEIGDYAFRGCAKMEKVTLPAGLERIGVMAFADCSGLTEITIPGNVAAIGSAAFVCCSSLRRAEILPGKLKNMPYGIFRGCMSLKEENINIPQSESFLVRHLGAGREFDNWIWCSNGDDLNEYNEECREN